MPFIQGKRPAITLHDPKDLIRLTEALCAAGYEKHGGLRITRRGELLTFRKRYLVSGDVKQQNHVQVVAMVSPKGRESIGVFGHTEPYGYGISHLISAVRDGANFSAGALMLRKDLKEHGYSGK